MFEDFGEYKGIFSPKNDYSSLENVEERYAWLKRTLRSYDEKYVAFFPATLWEHFCHLTHQHLVEVLGGTGHFVDPELLVRVLRKSIDFENELVRRYSNTGTKGGYATVKHMSDIMEKGEPDYEAGGAVERYKDELRNCCSGDAPRKEEELEDSAAPRFRGIISECFASGPSSYSRTTRRTHTNENQIDNSMSEACAK